jgi:phage baseplate assembly protein W
MAKYFDFNNRLTADAILVEDEVALSQSLERLFQSQYGDLIDDPTYSGSLKKYLYEPQTEDTVQFLEMDVKRNLRIWEPRVTLQRIQVSQDLEKQTLFLEMAIYSEEFDKYITINTEIR